MSRNHVTIRAAIDLTDSASAKLGQRVVAVRWMGKFFARTVVAAEGRVGGITKKPRDLYIPTGSIGSAVGPPISTAEGKMLGVTIMQMADSGDMGQFSSFEDLAALVMLPAKDVVKATERALASVGSEDNG